MLVVNPWHWLTDDGEPPTDNLGLRRRVLRVARFIEYGGPLKPGQARETLVECTKRPGRKPCLGLMWVTKTPQDDQIYAWCPACENDEVLITDWQDTLWSDGPMEPVPPDDTPKVTN